MVRTGSYPFRFLRNQVVVDKSDADNRPPWPANTYVVAIQNVTEAADNTYSTNLPPARMLAANYDGSTVRNETYLGQFIRR